MQSSRFFAYSWTVDKREEYQTVMRIYGLDKDDKNICIIVDDFTPYAYLQLPDNIDWDEAKATQVCNKIDQLLGDDKKPIIKYLTYKKKLYYAHLDEDLNRKKFPYIFLCFSHHSHSQALSSKCRYPMFITGIGKINVKLHEFNASPILQLTSLKKLPTAGWISFKGRKVEKDEQTTNCVNEYICSWKRLSPYDCNDTARPLLMGFDIEVNSSIPSSMPKPYRLEDKIFQISCIFGRQGSKYDTYEKYLLSLGKPDPAGLGDDVILKTYICESEMLEGFTNLINEKQPNIIMGYNIFEFDIDYMIKRAETLCCVREFSVQGLIKDREAELKEIGWSSSAYKNQKFKFLDAEGRLYVDILPIVKRDYKFSNYKLKTIASHFLRDMTKDPLDAQGIFKCYRLGMEGGKKGSKALSIVGKYCVKDSLLVVRLFEVLTCWVALCEMSKVCNVPIFQLYTQGQQLKVFSQTYKKCTHDDIVVEKDAYIPKEDDHYVGATVYPPLPGVYDKVVPFDFCLSGESEISTTNGYSVKLKDYIDQDVISWNNDTFNVKSSKGLLSKGEKETIKIWFQDGTSIISTPDHKFMLDNGSWCEAKDLKDKYVKCGLTQPLDTKCDKEDNWSLVMSSLVLNMKDTKNRDDALAFARMLGYILSDGSIYVSRNTPRCEVYLGTRIDAEDFMKDLLKFDREVTIRKRSRGIKGTTYCITLPSKITRNIHSLHNIIIGKRATQPMKLPSFLFDDNCPKSIIREFIAGLFGGDATAPYYVKGSTSSFGNISFKWTTITKYENDMKIVFESIKKLLTKFDINSSIYFKNVKYSDTSIKPKDYKTNARVDLILAMDNIYIKNYQEKIGFRYCINKSSKLTIAHSYINMCINTREQSSRVFERTKILTNKLSTKESLNIARDEIFKNEPPINQYSLCSVKYIGYQKHEEKRHSDKPRRLSLQKKYFPTTLEYLNDTNSIEWFATTKIKKYAITSDATKIPSFRKKVIGIFDNGIIPVYDIFEVNDTHNFLANGVVASNCSLYPSTIIAYNIDWSTLVPEDTLISESLTHNMEWEEHLGCEHDPKEIRKNEINKIIKEKEVILKNLRAERDKKENKHNKESFKKKIEKVLQSIKPYREERSEITKSKPKHIICGKRKFRWLKQPMGVLPEILTHLLDTRAATKNEMKNVKAKLKEMKEDTPDYNWTSTYLDVLNQRQLALKVSANSAYGAMGVKKGYLPFMPGAMCTTYKGRTAIQKAADTITKEYKGVLIYGDTDSNYVSFPHLDSAADCWDYSLKVASEVSKLFPKPMSLAFEEKVYWRFFILAKKRYMSLSCERDGKVKNEINKKGVLLQRRDNSQVVRSIYGDTTMMIFDKKPYEEIIDHIVTCLDKMYCCQYKDEDFCITKSIGIIDLEKPPVESKNNKGTTCYKIGDYTVKLLEQKGKKRDEQLLKKDCLLRNCSCDDSLCDSCREYYLKSLPAQAQLAEKMRNRGQLVSAGSRIEYIITTTGGRNANQYIKVEDFNYYLKHKAYIKIDYLYYHKQLTNPIDQLLNIIFPKNKDFLLKHYKHRVQKEKMLEELKSMFSPTIIIKKK